MRMTMQLDDLKPPMPAHHFPVYLGMVLVVIAIVGGGVLMSRNMNNTRVTTKSETTTDSSVNSVIPDSALARTSTTSHADAGNIMDVASRRINSN